MYMNGIDPSFWGIMVGLGGALICYLLAFAAQILCAIFLGLWAYRDASLRGVNLPGLIGVAVAMTPYFIGLIVYLCTRPKESGGQMCATCGAPSKNGVRFCASCGHALEGENVRPIDGKRPKPMLIGFFISLGVCVLLWIGAIAFYVGGIFGIVNSATRGMSYPHEIAPYDIRPNFEGGFYDESFEFGFEFPGSPS